MDNVHDNKPKDYGRSTADVGLETPAFEQSAILSPPPFQSQTEAYSANN